MISSTMSGSWVIAIRMMQTLGEGMKPWSYLNLVAFKEGAVRILLGKLMTNFLRHFKLCPVQYTPNIFRVVSSVAEQNKRLSLNLTKNDINEVYSCQDNSTSGYYFKFQHGERRLVSCLPDSDKETEEDFLVIMGNWHLDELPCPIS